MMRRPAIIFDKALEQSEETHSSPHNYRGNVSLADALDCYHAWDCPITIISDGPYGIKGYKGDLASASALRNFYAPHIKAWSDKATAQTTLWFWNTEVGWASVHPELLAQGWVYKGFNIWNKGISHIAGNCNGRTMRSFPVATEACVQYVRPESFSRHDGVSVQQWLRQEWLRTGLPFSKANEACGVKNAATRKYLTKDELWYFPPTQEFLKLVQYANTYGRKENAPYFYLDKDHITLDPQALSAQWERLRAKFNFEYGTTNVWEEKSLRAHQRFKIFDPLEKKYLSHPNEKPQALMKRIIEASSGPGDTIWEPFAGSGSASLYCLQNKRPFFCAELEPDYYRILKSRLLSCKPFSDSLKFNERTK